MFNLIPWNRKTPAQQGGELTRGQEHPLMQLRNEMDVLFDRFWRDWPDFDQAFKGWPVLGEELPNLGWGMEVDDRENEIVVRAEAPGFEPKEFDVRVSSGHLILEAEHKEESKEGNGRRYQYGQFRRTLPLPPGIEEDKIEAKYRNGVLEVKVPKGEAAKAKRITVQAS